MWWNFYIWTFIWWSILHSCINGHFYAYLNPNNDKLIDEKNKSKKEEDIIRYEDITKEIKEEKKKKRKRNRKRKRKRKINNR